MWSCNMLLTFSIIDDIVINMSAEEIIFNVRLIEMTYLFFLFRNEIFISWAARQPQFETGNH